ncbi:phosphate ABC transporter permease PstA [soil metagenome]
MEDLKPMIFRRKLTDIAFGVLGALSIVIALLVLAILIFDLARSGVPRLSWDFFISFPSRFANKAGILSAWVGSCLIMLVTTACALPLGVAAGVYLEEYSRKTRLSAIIEINIANLSGVPSIIWGLMALGIFIHQLHFKPSIFVAGLTLGLLVLPIVIIATRESIRAIPQSIREASYACGATRWQTTWYHVIPYSMSGILTGSIIALSRAIGETAPLITIGALSYIAYLPDSPFQRSFPFISFEWAKSGYTALPIQMFNWVSRPDRRFQANAAAAGIVLILLTVSMNAVAIFLRYKLRKRISW